MTSPLPPKPHAVEVTCFYRVEPEVRDESECKCENCILWTIVYDDPQPVEIGQSWQGPDGKEAAEGICELMNMAFDAGMEQRR